MPHGDDTDEELREPSESAFLVPLAFRFPERKRQRNPARYVHMDVNESAVGNSENLGSLVATGTHQR